MRPAKVYLDNSDLSRLYNAKAHGLEQLRDAIIARADDGRATFWYSYWHVFEFLQPAEGKYIEDRRERAAFLKQLCGTNTLPYFSDILEARDVTEGLWMPTAVFNRASATIKEKIDSKLESRGQLSRANRRRAHSPALRRKLFRQIFPSNTYELTMQREHGLTPEFVNAAPISRCIRGEISNEEMKLYFARMFCDPEYFFQKWFIELGYENPLKSTVLEVGRNWLAKIQSAREKYDRYVQARRAAVKSRQALHNDLRSSILPNELKKVVAAKIRENLEIPPLIALDDALATDVFDHDRLKFIECYIRHRVNSSEGKENDIADLMHVFYVADVDIMRCDKAIFESLKNCPHLTTSKLVSRLEDVPAYIDRFSELPSL